MQDRRLAPAPEEREEPLLLEEVIDEGEGGVEPAAAAPGLSLRLRNG